MFQKQNFFMRIFPLNYGLFRNEAKNSLNWVILQIGEKSVAISLFWHKKRVSGSGSAENIDE
jgi:hypothetical protein